MSQNGEEAGVEGVGVGPGERGGHSVAGFSCPDPSPVLAQGPLQAQDFCSEFSFLLREVRVQFLSLALKIPVFPVAQ